MNRWRSASVRRAFVDSSAYHALADARDGSHQPARTIGARFIAQHCRLFTTNFILAETHALVLARAGRVLALEVIQGIESGATVVVRVSVRDERRARQIIAHYDDKDFTLTDATSFAVMERLHIDHAFTFDRDFVQYGFAMLTA